MLRGVADTASFNHSNRRFEQSEVSNNRENHFERKIRSTKGIQCHPKRPRLTHEGLHGSIAHTNLKIQTTTKCNQIMRPRFSLCFPNTDVKTNRRVSIAFAFVLECLQEGFASPDARKLLPETTLTQGFSKEAKEDRFTMIKHQHRMNEKSPLFTGMNSMMV